MGVSTTNHVKHKFNKHGEYHTNHETIKQNENHKHHKHPNGHNAYVCALELGHTCLFKQGENTKYRSI